ncbi:MAG: DUF4760 domain-containing protein [Anaerolineales bacterium]
MQSAFVFDIIRTLAVVMGIFFGLIQLRQYRISRKRESTLYLVKSMQTKEFVSGLWIIQGLRDGITKLQLEQEMGDKLESIIFVMSMWETIGILLFHHEITIELVDEAFSGPIIFSWQKLERYIHDFREETGRETHFEWFQWLSDRMKEREGLRSRVPAYASIGDWQ